MTKFKIILALVATLYAVAAWSQTSNLDDYSVPYYKKTVKIKEYKPKIYISITYVDDNNYISILSLRRTDGFCGVPDMVFNLYVGDIKIKDFDFIGDTAFICGEHISKEGFIGFFNIDTLFNAYWDIHSGWIHTPKPIYIHKGFDTRYNGAAKTLDKMVAYRDPEAWTRHVSCIGEAETDEAEGPFVKRDCIVDFYEYFNTWFYTTGVPDHTNTDSFEDIAYVQGSFHDFVVTAGFEMDSCLTIRLFNSAGLFSLPAMNTVHIYNDFSATAKHLWKTGNLEMAAEGDGKFLTASIWRYQLEILPIKNRIHVSKFDTYLIYNNVASSMVWSRELSSLDFPDNTAIHGLAVNEPKHSYGLVFEADQTLVGSVNNRSFFLELDNTMENVHNGLLADGYGNALDLNLRGLDGCLNGSKYLMAGFCLPAAYHKITNLFETPHVQSQCEPPIEAFVKTLEPVKHNYSEKPILTLGGRVSFIPLETVFENTGTYHPCPARETEDEGLNDNE